MTTTTNDHSGTTMTTRRHPAWRPPPPLWAPARVRVRRRREGEATTRGRGDDDEPAPTTTNTSHHTHNHCCEQLLAQWERVQLQHGEGMATPPSKQPDEKASISDQQCVTVVGVGFVSHSHLEFDHWDLDEISTRMCFVWVSCSHLEPGI